MRRSFHGIDIAFSFETLRLPIDGAPLVRRKGEDLLTV